MTATAWLWLLAAGVVEVGFSQSIKPTEQFTRPLPTLACLLLGAGSIFLLSKAMQGVAVGTAYTVFTAIGSVGAVALGAAIHRDPVNGGRLLGLALIVAGVLLCRAGEAGAKD